VKEVFCRSYLLPGSGHRHGCWRQTPFHGRHLVGHLISFSMKWITSVVVCILILWSVQHSLAHAGRKWVELVVEYSICSIFTKMTGTEVAFYFVCLVVGSWEEFWKCK
jgi:hypothetical protein